MPRLTANGVELYYEDLGEGLPLVLQAHHHQAWMPFQVAYFSQFYRVITFDRRGTGRSGSPGGEWRAADFAADLLGLLDGRGRLCPCLLYTSPSPRDRTRSRMPSSA